MIAKYIKEELGYNELLSNRERLFNKFDDLINLVFKSTKEIIRQKIQLTKEIENYLNELEKFVSMRKKNPLNRFLMGEKDNQQIYYFLYLVF